MIPQVDQLTEEEQELVYKGPLLVTILIAGADDDIDKNEKEKAVLAATFNYQTFVYEPKIEKFYKEVTKNFMGKLNKLIQSLPPKAAERNPVIASELEKLNDIWPKMDTEFSMLYYESLKSIADQVAKASGGLLGLASVSKEEKEWVGLNMLKDPV
ncbi:MAG: hypothetical protein JKY33_01595 [Bacteroidia bacterium]|nr:hypothetical protein [Bacteroidia bacterium]